MNPDIIPFLTHLIDTSLKTGCFPNNLTAVRVNLLLKKPTVNPSDVKNYRPVFLLPFLSRFYLHSIFCISTRTTYWPPLVWFWRAGHSTETALLAFTEELHTSRAASLSSVTILLDCSAEFDMVNHWILLSTPLGFSGSALSLFTTYIKDCTYRVTCSGSLLQGNLQRICVWTLCTNNWVPSFFLSVHLSLGSVCPVYASALNLHRRYGVGAP